MPYLAFDLDALAVVPDAARSAGLSEGDLALGLLRMWSFCFKKKTDTASEAHIAGFFGGDAARVKTALETFGFLDGDRVKGADRYLRIAAARSRGGQASKGNLKQNRDAGKDAAKPAEAAHRLPSGSAPADHRLKPDASRTPAGRQPELMSGSAPALTPSTEHRAPVEDLAGQKPPAPKKPKSERPPDPRHAPMVKALVEAVPGYAFQPRDAKAVSDLLALGPDPEIIARWKRARARNDYPRTRTLSELVANWEHFGADAPTPTAAKGEPPCRLL